MELSYKYNDFFCNIYNIWSNTIHAIYLYHNQQPTIIYQNVHVLKWVGTKLWQRTTNNGLYTNPIFQTANKFFKWTQVNYLVKSQLNICAF